MRIGQFRSKRIHRQINIEQNRWIIPYADLITLLFAFFVVMYAISSVNLNKYKTVVASVGYAFEGKKRQGLDKKLLAPNIQTILHKKDKFKIISSNFRILDGNFFNVTGHEGWFEIQISANKLFHNDQAKILTEAIPELLQLATLLHSVKGPIIIEGYTDNVPISNQFFSSNWVLSAARAAAIAELLDKSGLNEKQISAIGFGSQYPIASNLNAEGRKKNHRVVIVIGDDKPSERSLNPLKSKLVLKQEADEYVKTKKVRVMKEIKTKDGGIKFIQSVIEKPVDKVKSDTSNNKNKSDKKEGTKQ